MIVRRMPRRTSRSTTVTARLISLAVDLELDLLRCETALASPALHALAAFANARANAAKVRTVPRAPSPDSTVGGVIAAQGLSTLRA